MGYTYTVSLNTTAGKFKFWQRRIEYPRSPDIFHVDDFLCACAVFDKRAISALVQIPSDTIAEINKLKFVQVTCSRVVLAWMMSR